MLETMRHVMSEAAISKVAVWREGGSRLRFWIRTPAAANRFSSDWSGSGSTLFGQVIASFASVLKTPCPVNARSPGVVPLDQLGGSGALH